MRLWSIHPKYLDSKRLVALWRETLLARAVLDGKTKGYKNHPQLNRFKIQSKPLELINTYLYDVFKEAEKRNYNFNKNKLEKTFTKKKIKVTTNQLKYEIQHLFKKLNKKISAKDLKNIQVNSIFKIIKGNIENWEKIK